MWVLYWKGKTYLLGEASKHLVVEGNGTYRVDDSSDSGGCMIRIKNLVERLDQKAEELFVKKEEVLANLKNSCIEFEKEFYREDELNEKMKRQKELEYLLSDDQEKEERENKKNKMR